MSQEKLCPFSFNNPGLAGFTYCRKERCALWVESKKCCAVKFIACMMSPLHEILNKLEKDKGDWSENIRISTSEVIK